MVTWTDAIVGIAQLRKFLVISSSAPPGPPPSAVVHRRPPKKGGLKNKTTIKAPKCRN